MLNTSPYNYTIRNLPITILDYLLLRHGAQNTFFLCIEYIPTVTTYNPAVTCGIHQTMMQVNCGYTRESVVDVTQYSIIVCSTLDSFTWVYHQKVLPTNMTMLDMT